MPTVDQVPVGEGLFTWPGPNPKLLGGRCRVCGTHTFPCQTGCPKCSATDMEQTELARRGRLWAWTTQDFRPKTPPFADPADDEAFGGFLLGYVELEDQVIVETRLVEVDMADLQLGMEMELTVIPLWRRTDAEVVSFAFRPVVEQTHRGGTDAD